MPWIPDLAPFTAVPGRRLVAVGWLSKDHEFPRSPVADAEALARLRSVRQRVAPRGLAVPMRCEFCDDAPRSASGVLCVVDGEQIFVAPELITHFVAKHRYAPPREFLAALDGAARLGASELRAALERHGVLEPLPRDEYGTGDLVVLEGLEPVRVRPGMYVGGTGSEGALHCVFDVIANALDEHLAGHATSLRVEVSPSGWIEIEDDGRGFPIEPTRSGLPAIESVCTQLHAGATYDGHAPHVHVSLHGVGIAVVNALCTRLEIETRRAGVAWCIAFDTGRTIKPLHALGATSKRGTRVRLLLDDEIFDSLHVDLAKLRARLCEIAALIPTLRLSLNGEVLSRAGGLASWLVEQVPSLRPETVLTGRGEVDGIGVEFAVGWSPEVRVPLRRSFVNLAETHGGTHHEAFARALENSTRDRSVRARARRGLCGLVHVTMLDPRFGGPTRATLDSPSAAPAVAQVVRAAIGDAPWFWDAIHSCVR